MDTNETEDQDQTAKSEFKQKDQNEIENNLT